MDNQLKRLTRDLEESEDYHVFHNKKAAAEWLFTGNEDDLQYLYHLITITPVSPNHVKEEVTVDEFLIHSLDGFTELDDGRVLFVYADKRIKD